MTVARVLVLRPRAPGLRTAARLASFGLEAVTAPILRIEPTDAPMPEGPFNAIGVTSAAALHRVGRLPQAMKALPLLAVGERTALLAREAGFAHVHAADGERHSLAALARNLFGGQVLGGQVLGGQVFGGEVSGGKPRPRLLLALGHDHKPDTPALLAAAGIEPVPWIVYAARAAQALPEPARAALAEGTVDAVVHYSRRSAATACDLVAAAGLWPAFAALAHYALSDDVAAPLKDLGVARVLVAERPHEDALLALFTGIDRPQGSP
ncbi:uroporphyrinogen-III synthase [Pseudochelatococcus sp. B33]